MWEYEKKLQYPVKIKNPNPKLAKIIITQYGGPDGEMSASLRYLSQRYSMPYSKQRRCYHRSARGYGRRAKGTYYLRQPAAPHR